MEKTRNLPRSGRPTKITPRAQRQLIQEVTKDPTTTSKELQASLASVKGQCREECYAACNIVQHDRFDGPARPGFVHSGTGVPHSLDAAAVEDASQAPGEDLSPSAATCLQDHETECDAVIIGDSIVRHVRAIAAKGKVRTRCLPGARVLDVAAQVSAILKKNIGAVVLHAGTNDIRLRQTEILKKVLLIIVSGPLPMFQ
ncbi:hypothetical protein QTP86_005482 [Hemibagrus guttatus]|nr:hypothetical protein QTP86_005482 [Hemibagrus guttatus]